MKFSIEKIILWNPDGRMFPYVFIPGKLNVISGARQTGRTSFVNIVDYVLGASQCYLPSIFSSHVGTLGVIVATEKRRLLFAREVPNGRKARGEKCTVETYGVEECIDIDSPPELTLRINDLRRILDEMACPMQKLPEHDESTGKIAPPSFREAFNFCQQDDLTIIRRDYLVRGFDASVRGIAERMHEILPFVFSVYDRRHMELRERIRALEAEGEQKKAAREKTAQHLRIVLDELASYLVAAREMGLIPIEATIPSTADSDALVDLARQVLTENSGAVVPQLQQDALDDGQQAAKELQTKQEECSRQIAKLQSDIAALDKKDKQIRDFMEDSGQLRDRIEVSEWIYDYFNSRFHFNNANASNPGHAASELDSLRNALKDFNETACSDSARDNYYIAFAGEMDRKKKQLSKKIKEISAYSTELKRLVGEDGDVRDFVVSPRRAYALLGKIENAVFMWDNLVGEALSLEALGNLNAEKKRCEEQLKGMEKAEEDREKNIEHEIGSRIGDLLKSLFVSRVFKEAQSIFKLKDLALSFHTQNGILPSSVAGASSNYICFHVAVSAAVMEYFCKTPDAPVPNFVLFDCPAQEDGVDENGEERHYAEQLAGTLIEALNDSIDNKWQPILILQSNTQPLRENADTHIVAHFNETEGIIPKEWLG